MSRFRMPIPQKPKGRLRQKEELVPLKIMKPVALRGFVSGRGDASSNVACIQEMTVMLACFKTNDFDQVQCAKELQGFQSCMTESRKALQAQREMEQKGVVVGEKKLSHLQVNKVLRKYPIS